MSDRILRAFLEFQLHDALGVTAGSDLVRLQPIAGSPPWRYLVEYRCTGLVHDGTRVVEANRFGVVISLPPDYLRRSRDSWEIVAWAGPHNVWHPNISRAICIGPVASGTGLVDLLYRVFELITYQKFCPREDNALNADACVWARANLARLPVDTRPLKWRSSDAAQGTG